MINKEDIGIESCLHCPGDNMPQLSQNCGYLSLVHYECEGKCVSRVTFLNDMKVIG